MPSLRYCKKYRQGHGKGCRWKMGKKTRDKRQRPRKQAQPAVASHSGEAQVNWQTLYDDASLRTGWLELTRALALAQRAADEHSTATQTPALPDLTYAARLLHQYPA